MGKESEQKDSKALDLELYKGGCSNLCIKFFVICADIMGTLDVAALQYFYGGFLCKLQASCCKLQSSPFQFAMYIIDDF